MYTCVAATGIQVSNTTIMLSKQADAMLSEYSDNNRGVHIQRPAASYLLWTTQARLSVKFEGLS